MAQDSITIERIDQEPFVVRRGDRVKVWFHQGYFKPMQVVGISPTRNMIRVSSSDAVRKVGFEVFKAFVFPPDPEPAPPKQKGAASLSGQCSSGSGSSCKGRVLEWNTLGRVSSA